MNHKKFTILWIGTVIAYFVLVASLWDVAAQRSGVQVQISKPDLGKVDLSNIEVESPKYTVEGHECVPFLAEEDGLVEVGTNGVKFKGDSIYIGKAICSLHLPVGAKIVGIKVLGRYPNPTACQSAQGSEHGGAWFDVQLLGYHIIPGSPGPQPEGIASLVLSSNSPAAPGETVFRVSKTSVSPAVPVQTALYRYYLDVTASAMFTADESCLAAPFEFVRAAVSYSVN